jgi:hypothetical protein
MQVTDAYENARVLTRQTLGLIDPVEASPEHGSDE